MIHELRQRGLSISAIARQLGLDRKTVRKYLNTDAAAVGVRAPSPHGGKLGPYHWYLNHRIKACPALSGTRLLREIRQLGYDGGYTILLNYLRAIRPPAVREFEVRFETPPGQQAQVDFACFHVCFQHTPEVVNRVWLFTMVLGHSRYLFGAFCRRQDLATVIRMHIEAFEYFGAVPGELLYDRMKTAVLDEDEHGEVRYNETLRVMLQHYGARGRACKAYRPRTKGKVERPYRYIREDFYLGSQFDHMDDLNAQFRKWLDEVANCRLHRTTGQYVDQAFAAQFEALVPLPKLRFEALLALERKVNNEGMVAYGGNYYSVPDGTSSRILEVQVKALELHIVDHGQVIARHAISEGKGQRIMDPTHRKARPTEAVIELPEDDDSLRRSLGFYAAVGQRLAGANGPVIS